MLSKPLSSEGLPNLRAIDLHDIETSNNIEYHKIVKCGFEETLASLRQQGKSFVDQSFQPNKKSLGEAVGRVGRKIIWRRIPDVVKNPILFDNIGSLTLSEDFLSGCYFFSTIAATAEKPVTIKNIFRQESICKQGIYALKVSDGGITRELLIDDWIPVYEQSGVPVFCRPIDDQIWIMLIEKAWAKLCGSYENIASGYPHEILRTFTNAPCFYMHIDGNIPDSQRLWNYLKEGTEKKYIMSAGTRTSKELQAVMKKNEVGLQPQHTYTILGCHTLHDSNHLVRLRNPWTHHNYNGALSRHDKTFWQAVDISKPPYQASWLSDATQTLMAFQDFINYFDSIDICHSRQGFSSNYESATTNSKHGAYFQVDIRNNEPVECYFTLQQPMQVSRNMQQTIEYARATIVVARLMPNNAYHYVGSKMETSFPSSVTVKGKNVEPGRYIVYCKVQWPQMTQRSFTLSVYTQAIAQLKQVKKEQHMNFIQRVMFSHAILNPKKEYLDGNSQWICCQLLYESGGYAYIAVSVSNVPTTILIEFSKQDFLRAGFKVKGFKQAKDARIKLLAKADQPQIIVCRILHNGQNRELVFPPPMRISRSV